MPAPSPDEAARIVERALPQAGGAARNSLIRHVDEVIRWNRHAGLVGKHDTGDILERLVKQSVGLHSLVTGEGGVPQAPAIVDVGSGGGFPGVVWAILEPGWRVLMVERREKKASFLERVVALLALDNAGVATGDAETLAARREYRGQFDVAATMAVGPPERTGPLVEGFLGATGVLATTLPRDADAPTRAGDALVLAAARDDVEFRYALYRRGTG